LGCRTVARHRDKPPVLPRVLLLGLAFVALPATAQSLGPNELGVIYNVNDASSLRVAQYYAQRRHIPAANLIGLPVPERASISREELNALREQMLQTLPSNVQSLLLVWSRPYAVECMSVTTAFAAGYQSRFCEPGCGPTMPSPLFDTRGWLPADTIGWLPAMLLPSADESLARSLIERGIHADGSAPTGAAYLVRTQDAARNVRAAGYVEVEALLSKRVRIVDIRTPVQKPLNDILAYFTGVARVDELSTLHFLPGAAADHLTSFGGQLDGSKQMSALEWLRQGATASYGSVSEPCAHLQKFPNPLVFINHYLHGDTLLEAYWKSVAMPGQGLFIGEPLARPYPNHS
jgi:uncharacterized protein (TIGR03790 family)